MTTVALIKLGILIVLNLSIASIITTVSTTTATTDIEPHFSNNNCNKISFNSISLHHYMTSKPSLIIEKGYSEKQIRNLNFQTRI